MNIKKHPDARWHHFFYAEAFSAKRGEKALNYYGDELLRTIGTPVAVKPYLRHISNISLDELLQVASLITNISVEDWKNGAFYSAYDNLDEKYVLQANINSTVYTIVITDDFDIRLYAGTQQRGDKQYPINNIVEVAIYLMERSFDVFGWLKEDLAIERKL